MNSFSQLNSYSSETIAYNSQSDYSIQWGTNYGNANVVVSGSTTHQLQNRQIIMTLFDPIKPLNVIVQSPLDAEGVAISGITYTGTNGNIVINQIDNATWVATGMWTIDDYNELFANTSVSINGLRTLDFEYQTTVSDQISEQRSFYTNVDVIPFGFSRPLSVTYNEDANALISGMSFSDVGNLNYTFTFDLQPPTAGNIKFGLIGSPANTISITDSRSYIDTILQGNIVYIPSDDYVSNSNVVVSVFNNTSNVSQGTSNISLVIGTTHDDYSIPSGWGFFIGANANIGTTEVGNLRITDQALDRQYSSTITLDNTTIGNLYNGATFIGNIATYTGNINQVNANLANIIFVPAASVSSSGNISYQQIQTSANITQANVTLPLTYQIKAIHAASNVELPVGTQINSNGTQPAAGSGNDFWHYKYTRDSLNLYVTPTQTGNLTVARSYNNYKYGPLAINVTPDYGIQSRLETRTAGTAGYFSAWIYIPSDAPISEINICRLNSNSTTNTLYLSAYNGKLYWTNNPSPVVFNTGSNPNFFNTSIIVGDITAGTWNHVALQITSGTIGPSGTQVVSAWYNGQPITAFYEGGGSYPPQTYGALQTGSTWQGKEHFSLINNFQFGAPLNGFFNSSGLTTAQRAQLALERRLTAVVDDCYIANAAIRPNLVAFTPAPVQWGGNATQLLTGV